MVTLSDIICALALITGLKENTAAAPPLPLSKSQKKKLRKKNNGQAVNIEGGVAVVEAEIPTQALKNSRHKDYVASIVAAIRNAIALRMTDAVTGCKASIARFTEETKSAFAAVLTAGIELLPDASHDLMMSYYVKHAGNFTPAAFVQLLDWHGGTSLEAIRTIANFEKEKHGARHSGSNLRHCLFLFITQ